MGDCDLLAACQVDQVKLPRQLHLRLHVLLLDADQEDAVTAGTVLVHVCTTNTVAGSGDEAAIFVKVLCGAPYRPPSLLQTT